MSALAFPPAPTLPRTTRSTRSRTRRGSTAPCPHRQRHLRAVPSGLAAPNGRPLPTGLAVPAGAPNLPGSAPSPAPGSTPSGRPASPAVTAFPAAFMPAPQTAPERTRVPQPAPERTRIARPASEPSRVARPVAEPSRVALPDSESVRAARPTTKSAGAAGEVPLRLTTRGRRVLVAGAFAAAIALGSLAGTLFPAQQAMPEQVQDVVVSQGESLWMIASSVAGEGQDVRDVVEQIRALNGLEESTLVTGQTLTIPAG